MPPVRNIQQAYPDGGDPDRFALSTFSPNCVGDLGVAHGSAAASAVWPSANLGLFFPFIVTGPDASQIGRAYTGAIWMNGAAVSGNIDVGIYDGAGNRLASIGTTAQAGTTAPQKASFAAPVVLTPGRYYLGVALDNGTGALVRSAPLAIAARAAGVRSRAASFVLPASVATWIGTAQAYLPWVTLVETSWA